MRDLIWPLTAIAAVLAIRALAALGQRLARREHRP